MTPRSLLPPNSSVLERALSAAGAAVDDIPVPLTDLWNPWTIPAELLPYLAWSLSIEQEWNFATTEQEQRALVANAVELHRYKGTPYAVRQGLKSAGFADAIISEGEPVLRHDGTVRRDGIEDYNVGRRWALFSITLDLGDRKGFSGVSAERVRTAINVWKNARSHLHRIELKASITEHRQPDATAKPWLHVGLTNAAGRPHVRDGRDRRAVPTRYLRDSTWSFDGQARRGLPVTWDGIRFGRARLTARFSADLLLQTARRPDLPRDASIRFDGSRLRSFSGAIDPSPPMADVSVYAERSAWPVIPGFLIYEDNQAWERGDPIDGPVYGTAVRAHARSGFTRDGSRVFGPDEQTYFTQQGQTVFQTVWDYDATQWDGNTTEWDQS